MITNERQHRLTRAEGRRFEEAIEQAENDRDAADIDPRVYQAMIDGLRSQLADLKAELDAYEALRNGAVKRRVLRSLLDIPNVLIEARIVRGLSQRALGVRLGLAEQQIQRYEATRYAGVAIERLQEVADALGLELGKTIDYGARPSTASRSRTAASVRRKKPGRRGVRVAGTALSPASRRSTGTKKPTAKARSAKQTQSTKKRATSKRKPAKRAATARSKTTEKPAEPRAKSQTRRATARAKKK